MNFLSKHFLLKYLLLCLLSALIAWLLYKPCGLGVKCQSCVTKAFALFLSVSLATMIVRGWPGVVWNIKSFFYKQQKIQ